MANPYNSKRNQNIINPGEKTLRPGNADLLKLYALYKQLVGGDVEAWPRAIAVNVFDGF